MSAGALERLRESTARVEAANEAHQQAIREVLSDLAWMGSQVYRVRENRIARGCAEVGDVVHIVEAWREADGSFHSEAHAKEVCPGTWCGVVGEQQFARYRRRGQRLGFTFRGECVVLAHVDGHLIVSPDISIASSKNGITS